MSEEVGHASSGYTELCGGIPIIYSQLYGTSDTASLNPVLSLTAVMMLLS